MAALLLWVSSLAYGESVAARGAPECPRPVISAGSPTESASCLQPLGTREERGPLLAAHMTLSERVDLVARHVRSQYGSHNEAVRVPEGSGALDPWSLIGGTVLLIAFAGMRRRQLFRDG